MAVNALKFDWPENCYWLSGKSKGRKALIHTETMNIVGAVASVPSLYSVSPVIFNALRRGN